MQKDEIIRTVPNQIILMKYFETFLQLYCEKKLKKIADKVNNSNKVEKVLKQMRAFNSPPSVKEYMEVIHSIPYFMLSKADTHVTASIVLMGKWKVDVGDKLGQASDTYLNGMVFALIEKGEAMTLSGKDNLNSLFNRFRSALDSYIKSAECPIERIPATNGSKMQSLSEMNDLASLVATSAKSTANTCKPVNPNALDIAFNFFLAYIDFRTTSKARLNSRVFGDLDGLVQQFMGEKREIAQLFWDFGSVWDNGLYNFESGLLDNEYIMPGATIQKIEQAITKSATKTSNIYLLTFLGIVECCESIDNFIVDNYSVNEEDQL